MHCNTDTQDLFFFFFVSALLPAYMGHPLQLLLSFFPITYFVAASPSGRGLMEYHQVQLSAFSIQGDNQFSKANDMPAVALFRDKPSKLRPHQIRPFSNLRHSLKLAEHNEQFYSYSKASAYTQRNVLYTRYIYLYANTPVFFFLGSVFLVCILIIQLGVRRSSIGQLFPV